MNVYDFDGTIYDGDSTRDFYFYCLGRFPRILAALPMQAFEFFKYACKKQTKTDFKQAFYKFFRYIPNIEKEILRFWKINAFKIKEWYKSNQTPDDVIISASPDFLLRPICSELGIKHLIASNVDCHTGKYSGINCWGAEKVRRFRELFPGKTIDEFYSDSYSDSPLAHLARYRRRVRKNKLLDW